MLFLLQVHVSYLGSSFAGWMRQQGKLTVDGTLAAAIAAAGLAETPPGFKESSSRAKRRAAKAERRAFKRASTAAAAAAPLSAGQAGAAAADGGLHEQQVALAGSDAGDSNGVAPLGLGAAAAAAATAEAAAAVAGELQLPSINCGGRTDAGVTAVGQVCNKEQNYCKLQPCYCALPV
jgi:hypothetical protein